MEKTLQGKTVLVTGGTRGIGKAIALEAATRGAGVIITYRDPAKTNRATRVQHELESFDVPVLVEILDITEEESRQAGLKKALDTFGKINALVLNAAGGLEAGKGDNYAMLINRDANLALVQEALETGLLAEGAWIIFMTSTWAHEYGQTEPPSFYLPVASTKRKAEDDLRALIPALAEQRVNFGVVVAPMVSDTGAYTIIKKKFRQALEQETGGEQMVTPEQVAAATLSYLENPALVSGHTVYVGLQV